MKYHFWRRWTKKLKKYPNATIGELEECIRSVCAKALKAKIINSRHNSVYCWNQKIADKRKLYFAAKRKLIRGSGKNIPAEERGERRKEYKICKKI